ncbi:AAA family ATPase [Larkinella soli]|uniref:AAA family ATPase n=1 Tax=Larkinella soli TaxID=1770527 RepID=UPI000FFBAC6A|nr:AAA family ATPase [Larkinella soli]
MIFTIGGIKGGSGKTTVAVNLTLRLARLPPDVLLVDADDQETATDFTAWRDETLNGATNYTAVKLTGESVRSQILKLRDKYDYVVIDTGGRDTTSQRAALSVSDVYLVPFNPRSFDIWTLQRVEQLILEIQAVRTVPLRAFAFLNRADFKGSDNRDAADLLSRSEPLLFLDTSLGNRKAFSHASARGLSVTELTPPDPKAVAETERLFQALLTHTHPRP